MQSNSLGSRPGKFFYTLQKSISIQNFQKKNFYSDSTV